MDIPYFLISQILGILTMILAVIFFFIMLSAWSKEKEPSKRIGYIIITSILVSLSIVLIFYGFKLF